MRLVHTCATPRRRPATSTHECRVARGSGAGGAWGNLRRSARQLGRLMHGPAELLATHVKLRDCSSQLVGVGSAVSLNTLKQGCLLLGTPTRLELVRADRLSSALELEELELEDKRVARSYVATRARIAVREFGRNVEQPRVSCDHQLHGLRPPFDHLVGSKGSRRAARIRRVENFPRRILLCGAALIVAGAGRARQGMLGAAAVRDHLVLQPRRERHHAVLGLVRVEKSIARGVGGRGEGQEE